jgi:hypothetical protein
MESDVPVSATPVERRLRAELAAHASWAQTSDPSARTKPARDAFFARFLNDVDPDRVLPEAERNRRAESSRSAYYSRLALLSVQARRRKAS